VINTVGIIVPILFGLFGSDLSSHQLMQGGEKNPFPALKWPISWVLLTIEAEANCEEIQALYIHGQGYSLQLFFNITLGSFSYQTHRRLLNAFDVEIGQLAVNITELLSNTFYYQ